MPAPDASRSPRLALCLADLHSHVTALERLDRRLTRDKERLALVLAAGDITIPGHEDYAREFIALVERHGLPLLLVHGNNDSARVVAIFREAGVTIHRQARAVAGRIFVGFGGDGNAPHDTELGPGELEDLPLAGAIFLTHVPPTPRLALSPTDDPDAPVTFAFGATPGTVIRDGPVAHLCGHIHATEGVGYLAGTKIIKLRAAMWNRAALLNLDTLHAEFLDLDPDGAPAPSRQRGRPRPATPG